MLLKQCTFYQFSKPLKEAYPGFELNLDLEGILNKRTFVPLGDLESIRTGFVPVLGKDAILLSHDVGGCIWFCVRRDEKRLSIAGLKAERLDAHEESTGRKPSRVERDQIIEAIHAEYLPKTIPTSKTTFCYLDIKREMFVAGTASAKQADDICRLFRQVFGSFPVAPLATKERPAKRLTDWMKDRDARSEFLSSHYPRIGHGCDVVETCENPGKTSFRNKDLWSGEVQALIDNGDEVRRLDLTLLNASKEDALSITLADDLSVKKLAFPDVVIDAGRAEAGEEADQRALLEADLLINAGSLGTLCDAIGEWFGGWM